MARIQRYPKHRNCNLNDLAISAPNKSTLMVANDVTTHEVSVPSSSTDKHVQSVMDEHETQYHNGVQIFGSSTIGECEGEGAGNIGNDRHKWTDEDFTRYQVQEGNAGPSESFLQNGNYIFETRKPLLTALECQEYIHAARETIQNEMNEQNNMDEDTTTSISTQRSNSELGEARLSKLPHETLKHLKRLLYTKLYPILSSQFGVDDLTVYDGLILGHIAPSNSQPVHRDASLLTINIPLSSPEEDYNGGGGTYIEGLENNHDWKPLCIEKGKALCHSSGIMHAGIGIQNGQRWVMVLFLIAKNEPQIARRLHASSLYEIRSNNLIEAEESLRAGLKYAPKDHLLTLGLGQIAAIKSNDENLEQSTRKMEYENYFNYLQEAVEKYPYSFKSLIAMGKILIEQGKFRAALRYFDTVLTLINDRDQLDCAFLQLKAQAWDARVSAARCAITCVDREFAGIKKNLVYGLRCKNASDKDNDVFGKNIWSHQLKLDEAVERLDACMIASPDNEYLIALRERAIHLLGSVKN